MANRNDKPELWMTRPSQIGSTKGFVHSSGPTIAAMGL